MKLVSIYIYIYIKIFDIAKYTFDLIVLNAFVYKNKIFI
jgi:hypothetical protein